MSIASILEEIARNRGVLTVMYVDKPESVVASLYLGEFKPEKRATCTIDFFGLLDKGDGHEEFMEFMDQLWVHSLKALLKDAKRKAGIPIS